ncbi:MAG: hypothetical protein ACRCZF_04450 [Gemmataceae bacterium]
MSPSLPPSASPQPRYQVLLPRSTETSLLQVVRVMRELTRFAEAEAYFRMWDAQLNGQSVVIETHLERAELYVEQFADRGVQVNLQPAEARR